MSNVEKNDPLAFDRRIAKIEYEKFKMELDELRRSSSVYADIDEYRSLHGENEDPFFLVDIEEYDELQHRVAFWKQVCKVLCDPVNLKYSLKDIMIDFRRNAIMCLKLDNADLTRMKTSFGGEDRRPLYTDSLYGDAVKAIKKNKYVIGVFTVEYENELPFTPEPEKPRRPFTQEEPRGNVFTGLGHDAKAQLKEYGITDKKTWKQFLLKHHPDRNPGEEKEKTELTQHINDLMIQAGYA